MSSSYQGHLQCLDLLDFWRQLTRKKDGCRLILKKTCLQILNIFRYFKPHLDFFDDFFLAYIRDFIYSFKIFEEIKCSNLFLKCIKENFRTRAR